MRQKLEEFAEDYNVELVFADGYDAAIVGVVEKDGHHSVVYSRCKIIEILTKDMDYDEAVEFFDFNIGGAYVGTSTPVYIQTDFD